MNRRNVFKAMVASLVGAIPMVARRTVDNARCPNCSGEGRELGTLSCWSKDSGAEKLYLDWTLKECRPCKVKWAVYTPKLKRREGPL